MIKKGKLLKLQDGSFLVIEDQTILSPGSALQTKHWMYVLAGAVYGEWAALV